MAEQDRQERPPEAKRSRRLPAVVRFFIAMTFGAMVAALASYLMRTIGF